MLLELLCTAFVFSFANLTVNLNVMFTIPFAVTGYSIPFYYGKLFTQDISPFLNGSIFPATS